MSKIDMDSFFVIVIDTREQNPYKFKGFLTVRKKLECGDYTLQGFENEIIIERKNTLDFLQSITRERNRFKEQLKKMSEMKAKFIVIEDTLENILNAARPARGKKREGYTIPITEVKINIPKDSIFNTIISIMIRYGIIFFFAKDRNEAEKFTFEVLKKYYKLKRKSEI